MAVAVAMAAVAAVAATFVVRRLARGVSLVHLGAADLAGRDVVRGRRSRLRANHASSERRREDAGERQIPSLVGHENEIPDGAAMAHGGAVDPMRCGAYFPRVPVGPR